MRIGGMNKQKPKEICMIEKVNEAGVKLRFIMLALFIIASLVFAIFYACDWKAEKSYSGTLAFWPPDMVPHPPHFPQPQPKPNEPVIARVG